MITSSWKNWNEQRTINWKLGWDVQEELGEEPTRRCSIRQELYGLQTQNVHTGYFSLNVLEQQKSFFWNVWMLQNNHGRGRWVRSKFSEFYSIFIFCLSFVCRSGFGILKLEKGKGYVVSLQCHIQLWSSPSECPDPFSCKTFGSWKRTLCFNLFFRCHLKSPLQRHWHVAGSGEVLMGG